MLDSLDWRTGAATGAATPEQLAFKRPSIREAILNTGLSQSRNFFHSLSSNSSAKPCNSHFVLFQDALLDVGPLLSNLSACPPNKTPVSAELRPLRPYLHIFRINTKTMRGKTMWIIPARRPRYHAPRRSTFLATRIRRSRNRNPMPINI